MPVYQSPADFLLAQGPADLQNSIMFGQKSTKFRSRELPYPSMKEFEKAGGSWNTVIQPVSSLVPCYQFQYPSLAENREGQIFKFGKRINLSAPVVVSYDAGGLVWSKQGRSKVENKILELYQFAFQPEYDRVVAAQKRQKKSDEQIKSAVEFSISFLDRFGPMSRVLGCNAIAGGRVVPWAFKPYTVDPSGSNFRKKEESRDIQDEEGLFQQMSYRQFIKDGVLIHPPVLTPFQIEARVSKHTMKGNPYLVFPAKALTLPKAYEMGLNTNFVPIKDKSSGIVHFPFMVYPDNQDVSSLLKFIRDMRDASPEERSRITPPVVRRYPDENGQVVFVSHVPYDESAVAELSNAEPITVDLTEFEEFSERVLADLRTSPVPVDYMPDNDLTLLGGYYIVQDNHQIPISEDEIKEQLISRQNGKVMIDDGQPGGTEVFYQPGELWQNPFNPEHADEKESAVFFDAQAVAEKARELGIPCIGDTPPEPFSFLDEKRPSARISTKSEAKSSFKTPDKPAATDGEQGVPPDEGVAVGVDDQDEGASKSARTKPKFQFKIAK